MRKPRFTPRPQTTDTRQIILTGPYKGKTVSWMADNAPGHLEQWAVERKIILARDIQDKVNKAKGKLF